MSDRVHQIWRSRQAALGAAASVQAHVAVWLGILALYMQLVAAGLCAAGLPLSPDPAAGLSAFPTCHSPSNDDSAGQAQSDHAPAHQHECPFCAVHCHAAMVMAPAISGLDSVYAVPKPANPAPFVVSQAARFPAGAPPRGPPASA
ncbi:MAG: DUF2946 family protein [Methylovirgula sp.]